MNSADLIVAAEVGAMVLLAARILWRNRRGGRRGCGGQCSGCGRGCGKGPGG